MYLVPVRMEEAMLQQAMVPISETQHSKSLIPAHATSPEEVGRELCSHPSHSGRDPGWWSIYLIIMWVYDHIVREKHRITILWVLNFPFKVTYLFTFPWRKQVTYLCLTSKGWRNVLLEWEGRNIWKKTKDYRTYLKTNEPTNEQKR